MPVTSNEPTTTPVDHLVTFRWKSTATSSAKETAKKELDELLKRINGIMEYVLGPQISTESPGKGWDLGFRVTFVDVAARDAYVTNPDHIAVVNEYVLPILDGVVVFDIQH